MHRNQTHFSRQPIPTKHKPDSTMKTSYTKTLTALAAIQIASILGAAEGQTNGTLPNFSGKPGTASAPVVAIEDLQLATHLEEFGTRSKSAPALALAALIQAKTGTQPLSTQKQPAKVEAKSASARPHRDAAALIAAARELNDPAAEALIAQASQALTERSRGAAGGPKIARTQVLPRDTDSFNVTFNGGELARVTVRGDGDTDLDLYIYDENGNLIAKDDDTLDVCLVSFTPRWSGSFRIVIRNLGTVYNEYVLRTN
jgi:hypothetical protein